MTDKTEKAPEFSSYRSLLNMDNAISKTPNFSKKVPGAINSSEKRCLKSKSPKRDYKKGNSHFKPAEKKENYDIPDRSHGDLYCKICDSHMNSDGMWAVHLQGKRHLKNMKSAGEPGKKTWLTSAERRHIYLNQDPEAQPEIDAVTEPIVGLQHVCEIIRLEQKPIYSCFLCNSTIPNPEQLIVHLLGLKHRLAYLKEHDKERYTLIHDSDLRKGQIEPVVEECVAKHEADEGRGKMIVKKEKPKPTYTWSEKKDSSRDHRNAPWDYHDHRDSSRDRRDSSRDRRDSSRDRRDSPRDRDSRPSRRSEREDLDFYESKRKRSTSGHSERSSDFNYGDQDRRYSDLRSSSENYHHENTSKKKADRGTLYSDYEVKRDDDYGIWNPADHMSKDVPYERNYSLSSPASTNLTNPYESRGVDLREILEQKKAPTVDNNISDEVLGIISALPTIPFFQLVLFKLDNMNIEDEVEIKFLDRVVNKATALAMSVKSKMLTPSLRKQFQESLAQNSVNIESDRELSKDVQDLLQMVGECKAQSSSRTQNATIPGLDMQRSYYPTPESSLNSPSVHGTTAHSTSYQRVPQSIRNEVVGASRRETEYPKPIQKPYSSVSNSYSSNYSTSYSSAFPTIPGLTLTESSQYPEKEPTSTVTSFDRMPAQAQAQTKSIYDSALWNFGSQKYPFRPN